MANGDDKKLKNFYNTLDQSGAIGGLPDFDTFRNRLSDPKARRRFHRTLQESGQFSGLPEYDDFNNRLFNGDSTGDPVQQRPTEPQQSREPQQTTQGRRETDPPDGLLARVKADFGSLMQGGANFFTHQVPAVTAIGEKVTQIGLTPAYAAFSALGMDTKSLDSAGDFDMEGVNELTNDIAKDIAETFPENPEIQGEFERAFFRGAGNLMSQIAGTKGLGVAKSLAMNALSFSGQSYNRALNETGDEDKAFDSLLANMPAGAVEMYPIGKLFKRVDRMTGGGIKKTLKSGFVGGGEELLQETTQTLYSNTADKLIYDKTRDLFEGVAMGGGVGFALGGLANAVGVNLKTRLSDPNMSKEERVETEKALRLATQTKKNIERDLRGGFIRNYSFKGTAVDPSISQEGAEGEGSRVGRSRPRPVDQELSQEGARTEGARVGRSRRRGTREVDQLEELGEQAPTADALNVDVASQIESQSQKEQETPQTIPISKPAKPDADQTFESPGPIKAKLKEWFLPQGNMPLAAYERKLKRDARIDAEAVKMQFLAEDLNNAIDEGYGTTSRVKNFIRGDGFEKGGPSKADLEQMNQVLQGEVDYDVLPSEVRGPLRSMRNHIDMMSDKIKTSGLAQGDMKMIIDENMGSYLNRSYKIFDKGEQWANNIPDDVKNKAIAFVRDRHNKLQDKDISDQEAENIIDRMLFDQAENGPMAVLNNSNPNSKDYSILRRRGEIAPEIRAVMGEYTNPIINYAKSIKKMANLVETHNFLGDVREMGLQAGWFSEPDNLTNPDHKAEIAPEGSEVLSPLNGLRTSPEVKEAFNDQGAYNHPVLDFFVKANAIVKYGKTVGSITTQFRNVTGGLGFAVANGHLPQDLHVREAMRITRGAFSGNNKAARERVIELKRKGVLSESASVGEIRSYMNEMPVGGDADIDSWGTKLDRGTNYMTRGLSKARQKANRLTDVYQGGDNFIRLMMFNSEAARYQKALPDASREEVENIAADIVSRTYQNYDRLPKATQFLRRFPAVGTFVSFPSEVIRSTVETIRQSNVEVQSDNPEIRKIGWRRRIGTAVGVGMGTAGAQAATMALVGVTDDEDDKARRFAAPWNKQSRWAYIEKSDGGFKFLDMSYTDPHEVIKDPILNYMMNGDENIEGSIALSMKELLKPFVGTDILTQKIGEVVANDKVVGGEVYTPGSPNRFHDIMGHLWEAFEPGTLTQASRIYKGMKGITEETGKKYNTSDELMALFGMRITEVDIKQSLKFKAFEYSKQISNARQIYRKVKGRRGRVRRGELDVAYEAANARLRDIYNEMRNDFDAATKWRVPPRQTKKVMKENGVPKWMLDAVERNRFQPFDRDGRNESR